MPQLENTVSLTIVRLGEAVPVVFFPSAVDFILPWALQRALPPVRADASVPNDAPSPAQMMHLPPPQVGMHGLAQQTWMRGDDLQSKNKEAHEAAEGVKHDHP